MAIKILISGERIETCVQRRGERNSTNMGIMVRSVSGGRLFMLHIAALIKLSARWNRTVARNYVNEHKTSE